VHGPSTRERTAERIEVTGVVQGVGMRPFVHRVATELGLDGEVGNDSARVFIDVSGEQEVIDRFVERLIAEAPPLAQIETVDRTARAVSRRPTIEPSEFRIVESRRVQGHRTLVSPDAAPCLDCTRELFDPGDRRFGHPFITCTNCGPRFTIIESLPYDRPNTTMARFEMCPACTREYANPSDRRYHAQPIACHDCGPTLSFRTVTGRVDQATDPVRQAADALADGRIVAIKGIGGYHLACDATDDAIVAELRARKHRPDKPFAVMVSGLDQAREIAHVRDDEARVLTSQAAPIVLLRALTDSPLAALVAPGNPLVGVMLPSTPVHHLLCAARRGPLVMTSANRSGEPIAFDDGAIQRLSDVFDAVLDHDRPIHIPCDDSVVRVADGHVLPIRRSRGYAPLPVPISTQGPPVLAVGSDLKNTFCVTTGGHAWVSQHIGDMSNVETLRAFEATVQRLTDFYDVHPEVVAADAHPAYMSSSWAHADHPGRVLRVQHHHAHVASVMAEHQIDPHQPVIGFAFDGTGYGTDGTIWGGEVLVADASSAERVAHLSPALVPGGDAVIGHPCRIALAHLYSADLAWAESLAPVRQFDDVTLRVLRRQLDRSIACVSTTSMGRLFDAVTSLVGLRHHISYEAQAAIELEIAAERSESVATASERRYRFVLEGDQIMVAPVLRAIVADLEQESADGDVAARLAMIAWRFHEAVAEIVGRVAECVRERRGLNAVALSGGTFQNVLLTRLCVERLDSSGFDAYTHRLVPPNDGGLSLGQAYVAAARAQMTEGEC
jgi:hydrogenase maturation protein HypF